MNALPPIVAVSALTSKASRFFCLPYRCGITADTCVRRQAIVRSGNRKRFDWERCIDCELGREVERAVGAMTIEREPNFMKHGGWTSLRIYPKAKG